MFNFTKAFLVSFITLSFIIPNASLAQSSGSLPGGCTSTAGFSPTTGAPCSVVVYPTFGDDVRNPNTETSDTTSDCTQLQNNMSYGTRDSKVDGEVTELQNFLKDKGYLRGNTSGTFGANTRKAVTAFQKAILPEVEASDIDSSIIPSSSDRQLIASAGFRLSSSGSVGKYTRAKISYVTCQGNDDTDEEETLSATPSISSVSINTTLKRITVEGASLEDVTSLKYTAPSSNGGTPTQSTLESIQAKSPTKVVFNYGTLTATNLTKTTNLWNISLTTSSGVNSPSFAWNRGSVCVYPMVINSSGVCSKVVTVKCPEGQVLNATVTGCIPVLSCPAPGVMVNGVCSITPQPITCPSPLVPNALGNACITSATVTDISTCLAQGKVLLGGASACSSCTSPQVPNTSGTSCVAPVSTNPMNNITGNIKLNPMFATCKVASGQSTCALSLTWDFNNIPAGYTTKLQSFTTFPGTVMPYTLPGNGNQNSSASYSIPVRVGTHKFYAEVRDGAGRVRSFPDLSVNITCDTGLTPNSSGVCGTGNTVVTVANVTLTQSASSTVLGAPFTVTWSSTNETSCQITITQPDGSSFHPGGETPLSGTKTLNFFQVGSYGIRINCTGPVAEATASITHAVTASQTNSAPTVILDAFKSPFPMTPNQTIQVGQSATIEFTSTNATACSGSGIWNGNLGGTHTNVGGASTPVMNTPGTYTQSVTCTGPSGSATSATRTLTVVPSTCNTSTSVVLQGWCTSLPVELSPAQVDAYYLENKINFDSIWNSVSTATLTSWGINNKTDFAKVHWVKFGRPDLLNNSAAWSINFLKVSSTSSSASGFATLFLAKNQPAVLGDYSTNIYCIDLPINLYRGMEKPSVTKLQDFLSQKGFLADANRGYYGDKTVEAVKDYQASKGLPETGMVYDFTRQEIMSETCR